MWAGSIPTAALADRCRIERQLDEGAMPSADLSGARRVTVRQVAIEIAHSKRSCDVRRQRALTIRPKRTTRSAAVWAQRRSCPQPIHPSPERKGMRPSIRASLVSDTPVAAQRLYQINPDAFRVGVQHR